MSVVKLSNTSKLGCKSWSLQAIETCPAAKDEKGELVPACKGCYATSGAYRFNIVKKVRFDNKQAWQVESFESDFIQALSKEKFFRWFDSGDMYSLALAEKMYNIMLHTPQVKHWLPTRMHKFKKFHNVLERMQALPNVNVRLSSDGINGELIQTSLNSTNSTIISANSDYDGFVCPSSLQDGKCKACKACFNKEVKTVAYIGHGVAMLKHQKLINIVNV